MAASGGLGRDLKYSGLGARDGTDPRFIIHRGDQELFLNTIE